jgi:hypothetical protein
MLLRGGLVIAPKNAVCRPEISIDAVNTALLRSFADMDFVFLLRLMVKTISERMFLYFTC